MSNVKTRGSSGKKRVKGSRRAELLAAAVAMQEENLATVAARREEVTHALDVALASRSEATIGLSEFLALTGAEPDADGEWGLYHVDAAGVRVSGVGGVLLGHPNALQVAAAELNQTPGLDFPCTASELLAFVNTPLAIADFPVAEEFRRIALKISPATTQVKRRYGPLARLIEDARARVGDSPRAVMDDLAKLKGVEGLHVRVLEATHQALIYEIPGNGPSKLTFEALQRRLGRLAAVSGR